VQCGQHAGVRSPEVAEVIVRRVLAAEDGPGLRHLRLDEGVADPGSQRDTAVLTDDLWYGPGGDQIVDDCRARLLG
jgi:hypothetical protein